MADPVDPLRRPPVVAPDLRGVARSEAAAERRRRRANKKNERGEDLPEPKKEEGGDSDEESDTPSHVDIRV